MKSLAPVLFLLSTEVKESLINVVYLRALWYFLTLYCNETIFITYFWEIFYTGKGSLLIKNVGGKKKNKQ